VSATGSSAARAGGFTLIEILVVVAILAIGAGVALATRDGDERGALAREARRFAGAVEYASDRARVRRETLGVSADGAQWRFWSRSGDGRWSALSGDAELQSRSLPPPLRVQALTYAGRPVAVEAIVPLRPSGRNEPFAFAFSGDNLQAVVTADPLTRVSVGDPSPVAR
jgi:general secretion pathway protein H